MQSFPDRFERIDSTSDGRRDERDGRAFQGVAEAILVGLPPGAAATKELADPLAGDSAEDRRIRDAVAAEPIRAVYTARILPGDEQCLALGRAILREFDTAH